MSVFATKHATVFFHLILNIDRKICKFLYPSPWPSLSHFLSLFFAAVALSVIDTSSSNFFAENWTQFPYSEFVAQTGVAGSGEEVLLESSDNNNQKKVNNAAVTVNSNKELQNPATSAISSSKETLDKVQPKDCFIKTGKISY